MTKWGVGYHISSSKTLRLRRSSSPAPQCAGLHAHHISCAAAAELFLREDHARAVFQRKIASAQDKIQVVASAFSGVDPLTPESAEQVISVLGNINAARLIVTNAEGTAVYDSSENQNAIGQRVLLPPWWRRCAAATCSTARIRMTRSSALPAVPIMDHDSPNGCVYLMDYDAEQGNIIANLERTILQGSFVLLGAIILFSAFFATTSSRPDAQNSDIDAHGARGRIQP